MALLGTAGLMTTESSQQMWCAGIMLYGTGYWGVTEANYLVVAGHLLSALFGAKLWEGECTNILGWQLPGGITLRRGDLNMVLVLGGGIQQSLGCILRTLESKARLCVF